MTKEHVPMPPVVARTEWLVKRKALLTEEKDLTHHMDRVNAARRRLPMVKLEKHYAFDKPGGQLDLLELFQGRRQLIVYHFMFDPAWENGCPGCTGLINALGDLSMLNQRNTTFAVISRAPLAKLQAYKEKKEWKIDWVSSFHSDFNYGFHVTLDEKVAPIEHNYRSARELAVNGGHVPSGEAHGMSVFFRVDNEVFHTYSAFQRGTENITNSSSLLDITPYGRQEDFEDSPPGWPQKPTYGSKT